MNQVMPMAAWKGAIPWWSIPTNWIVGTDIKYFGMNINSHWIPTVTFGNLVGSLFFAAILVKCKLPVTFDLNYSLNALNFLRLRNCLNWTIWGFYPGIRYVCTTSTYTLAISLLILSTTLRKKAGTPEWHQIFLRGIGCNWLVSIAVWVCFMSLLLLVIISSSLLYQQAAGAKETISKVGNYHLLGMSFSIFLMLLKICHRLWLYGFQFGYVLWSLEVCIKFSNIAWDRSLSHVDLTMVCPLKALTKDNTAANPIYPF